MVLIIAAVGVGVVEVSMVFKLSKQSSLLVASLGVISHSWESRANSRESEIVPRRLSCVKAVISLSSNAEFMVKFPPVVVSLEE